MTANTLPEPGIGHLRLAGAHRRSLDPVWGIVRSSWKHRAARCEIDVVLVWRLDRWGRSVTDLLATSRNWNISAFVSFH
jgi:hypothetical protein